MLRVYFRHDRRPGVVLPRRWALCSSSGSRRHFRKNCGRQILDFGSWQRDNPGNERFCATTRKFATVMTISREPSKNLLMSEADIFLDFFGRVAGRLLPYAREQRSEVNLPVVTGDDLISTFSWSRIDTACRGLKTPFSKTA